MIYYMGRSVKYGKCDPTVDRRICGVSFQIWKVGLTPKNLQ
ncbi:MAG: hypothetical protein QXH09_05890 [Candidatus Bathyarchaeia archaeon]